jgi:DNA-binding transcriptional MerR regulator
MKSRNIYLIKDLAQLTGYSIYTIKFYYKLGLIKEVGRSFGTNYRYFDDTTIEELKRIRQLRRSKKSLKEIKQILDRE